MAEGTATVLAIGTATPSCRVNILTSIFALPIVSTRLSSKKRYMHLTERESQYLEGAISGHIREVGLTFHLLKDVPELISKNIEKLLLKPFNHWVCLTTILSFGLHILGGPAILDQIDAKLGLKPEKLQVTRHVLNEYGNMSSASVLFILDEMWRKSKEDRLAATGKGLERRGVLFGFRPGLTVETIVLHSVERI